MEAGCLICGEMLGDEAAIHCRDCADLAWRDKVLFQQLGMLNATMEAVARQLYDICLVLKERTPDVD